MQLRGPKVLHAPVVWRCRGWWWSVVGEELREQCNERDLDYPNLKVLTVFAQDHSGDDYLSLQTQIQKFQREWRTSCAWHKQLWLAWMYLCWCHAARTPLGTGSACSDLALSRFTAVVSCVACLC